MNFFKKSPTRTEIADGLLEITLNAQNELMTWAERIQASPIERLRSQTSLIIFPLCAVTSNLVGVKSSEAMYQFVEAHHTYFDCFPGQEALVGLSEQVIW